MPKIGQRDIGLRFFTAMQNRIFTTTLLLCWTLSLLTTSTHAASITVPGIPFFDSSLGSLTSAEVTIDFSEVVLNRAPMISRLPLPGEPVEEIEHTHITTIPTITFLNREFVFGPQTTESAIYRFDRAHAHTFDPEPVTVRFESAELEPFLEDLSGIFIDAPPDFATPLLPGFSTDSVLDHHHEHFGIALRHPTDSSTTFEFIPVPEPSTGLLIVVGTLLMDYRIRRRL